MIEGLGRTDALQPERGKAKAKEPGSSFAEWLEGKAAEAAERKSLQNEAGGDTDNAWTTVDFHFRRGQQAAEVVSVPWRLRGNGRLSQNPFASANGAVALAANAAPAPASMNADARAPAPALTSIRADARQYAPAQTPSAWTPSPEPSRPPLATGESGSDPVVATSAPEAAWAERLVRWFERNGRDPELWIRDYALDEQAAQKIADALRASAGERGIRLERIVLNARELWRAPPSRKENF